MQLPLCTVRIVSGGENPACILGDLAIFLWKRDVKYAIIGSQYRI